MNPHEAESWSEQSRRFSPDEQVAGRQEERRLTRLLQQLPDAPVPSNFTSQVLLAVTREEAQAARPQQREVPAWWAGFKWVSRLAVAGCFLLIVGRFTLQQTKLTAERRWQFAHSVETVAPMAALPTDWLANFETINRLSQSAPADTELLALLE